jgi:hypothetical protein
VEESVEAVAFGIGLFLAGRSLCGERKTDATFRRSGTHVLRKVEEWSVPVTQSARTLLCLADAGRLAGDHSVSSVDRLCLFDE